jgi:tetratricopeptide (TPR) repeat protein
MAGMLSLEARDFESVAQFRWVLTSAEGELLADHQVWLDTSSSEYEAFKDLHHHLHWRAAPDRLTGPADQARLVGQIGAWIGTHVFGPIGPALVAAAPVTVRIIVPRAASRLAFCPLELAHVGGKPLAIQDVSLVMQAEGQADEQAEAVLATGRLRVLGLFSLPADGRALNLRHERQILLDVFAKVAAAGRAVETRVLQYGVTRQRLRQVLGEEEGWDVVHISGHGGPGQLLLETDDGSADAIGPTDLAGLLGAARRRPSLVTLSACWSAAPDAIGRLLGVPEAEHDQEPPPLAAAVRAMPTYLVDQLGCAVLAMRYPVADEFAIMFAERVYGLLAGQGETLPRAVSTALKAIAGSKRSSAFPALSVVTPALFGASAAELTLAAPEGNWPGPDETGMLADFPPRGDRFVGRTAVMTRASAALAPRSGWSGVLLRGMPGGGKTACAVELASTHQHAFDRMVWFKVPDEADDQCGALFSFASVLERLLPGLRMVHLLEDPARLTAFLPQLTELVARRRVLAVIDGAEALLTETGHWRYDPWRRVIAAMTTHEGLGRLVLTSRRWPQGAKLPVRAETVDALSRDETLLLAGELPDLRRLIDGAVAGIEPAVARRLARSALELALGNPKMLELADGQAAAPELLRALIAAGDRAWSETGGLPTGFFTAGAGQASEEDFLHVLQTWTQTVAAGLASADRDLLWFLCCLQESDRVRFVAEANWAVPRSASTADLDAALGRLTAASLISIQNDGCDTPQGYEIHPAIAASARAHAGADYRHMLDARLAEYWEQTCRYLLRQEAEAGTSRHIKDAAIAAVPYLLFQGKPLAAAALLDEVLLRDGTRATALAVRPALTSIATTAAGSAKMTAALSLLRVLDIIGISSVADNPTLAAIFGSVGGLADFGYLKDGPQSVQDYRALAAMASLMIRRELHDGQYDEAARIAEQQLDTASRLGMGPWSRLEFEVWRLEVMTAVGRYGQALEGVARLRDYMSTLPASSRQPETATPWRVRERLLTVGQDAAIRAERWQDALDLSAAIIASMRARGAERPDLATALFGRHGALVELGHIEEARKVLLECRDIYQADYNFRLLGPVLSGLAQIEDRRGHPDVAIELERNALRYKYLANDVGTIPISHYGLAYFSRRHTGRPGTATEHYLAAALICVLTASHDASAINALGDDLREADDLTAVPADVTELCRQVAQVPGADLAGLLDSLTPDQATVRRRFNGVIAEARAHAAGAHAPATERALPDDLPRFFAMWDPAIAGLVAAAQGDGRAAAALREHLSRIEQAAGPWAPLARALSRLNANPNIRDPAAGLDDTGTAIIRRAKEATSGNLSLPEVLWHVMPWGYTLADIVAGGQGDMAAAASAASELERFEQRNPPATALCAALRRILGGDRDPGLASRLADALDRAVVSSVLQHVGPG